MLAAFATSSTGKVYGRSCERYGVDPGAILTDDVLAFNLRVALALSDLPEASEEAPNERTDVRGNPGLYEQMKASRG